MKLKYGYSFYPEHCADEEELRRDIHIIKESGANVVRMGEFCWDQLESADGEFHMEILKRAVDLLGAEGIATVICTPTSCPPSWLYSKYPEIAYVNYGGHQRPFGHRHSYCYNSPVYRKYSVRIAEKLGEVFGKDPNVIGFQVGNEFAQEGSGRCHCAACAEKFREFLREKYGTVENFNQACGTYFWGLSFKEFDQVTPPTATIEPRTAPAFVDYYDNPGLRLNFERFASNSIVDYANLQVEALRRYTDKTVTTNATGFGMNLVDYYDLFSAMDLYGFDIYPDLYAGDKDLTELSYAFARNIKQDKFWLLEFAVGGGHGLWAGEGRLQPYPGAIKLHVMHAFANDASLLAHFQYKTFRSGAEQLNYALLDADRVPRRRYREFQETAKLLESWEPVLLETSCPKARIAIVFDYDAYWALRIKPIHREFDYVNYIMEIHTALRRRGYRVDIISGEQISPEYKMIILPTLFVSDEETTKRLYTYVEEGGYLFATFLTGVKDMHNVAYQTGLPGGLKDLFGMEVYEVEPVFAASETEVEIQAPEYGIEGLVSKDRYWIDEITPLGAETVAVFRDSYRKGHSIATENRYGLGRAFYCGTALEEQAMARLLEGIARSVGVQAAATQVPEQVSVVERVKGTEHYYFLFNFSKESQKILVEQEEIVLEPFGVRMVRAVRWNSLCAIRPEKGFSL